MKSLNITPLIIVSTGLLVGFAQAQGSKNAMSEIGMLPVEKVGTVVRAGEPNNFAKQAVRVVKRKKTTGLATEEEVLRQLLTRLRVSGVSEGRNGKRVLLGDLILEKGKPLPRMIPNQTERLIVRDIQKDKIEIAWVEKEMVKKPRMQTIPINIDPDVEYLLQGQAGFAGHKMMGSGRSEKAKGSGDAFDVFMDNPAPRQ
ncbi:MAG: hypothetical protein AAF514_18625 [Verrucomicrobiota bacterium]